MAATNASAVKVALLALLQPALAPVRVDYAFNGKLVEREYVYFGKATGPHNPMVFRSGGRLPRQEELTVEIDGIVRLPGGTPQEAEVRLIAIGQVIEETIANDPKLGGTVAGLMAVFVSHLELTAGFTDDGVASAALTIQVSVQSMLT